MCRLTEFKIFRFLLPLWFFSSIRLALPIMGLLGLTNNSYAFSIYGFIPYESIVQHGKPVKVKSRNEWFEALGVKPIDVVYERRMITVLKDNIGEKKFSLNRDMMKEVALGHGRNTKTIVSLDIESWDRFDEKTPTRLIEAIQAFREVNKDTQLGLYATVPQNTYSWKSSKRKQYDLLNSKYASVAEAVDYFSPSLYNYSKDDYATWLAGAAYNLAASKKYSKDKKVIPYITPEIWEDGYTRWLSYDEMKKRLQALKDLGADGCIVWASSQSRSITGEKPVLDPGFGWLKAVVEFATPSLSTPSPQKSP